MFIDHEAENLLFDMRTGLAQNESSRKFVLNEIREALLILKQRIEIPFFVDEAQFRVEILGMGGSYMYGIPRIGLWPTSIDYFGARQMEDFMPKLEQQSLGYPSDVDVIFRAVQLNKLPAPYSDRKMHALTTKIPMEIYDSKRVLLSCKSAPNEMPIPYYRTMAALKRIERVLHR